MKAGRGKKSAKCWAVRRRGDQGRGSGGGACSGVPAFRRFFQSGFRPFSLCRPGLHVHPTPIHLPRPTMVFSHKPVGASGVQFVRNCREFREICSAVVSLKFFPSVSCCIFRIAVDVTCRVCRVGLASCIFMQSTWLHQQAALRTICRTNSCPARTSS